MKKKIPKSIKKHIRKRKSFIKKKSLNSEKQKESINSLYNSFLNKK